MLEFDLTEEKRALQRLAYYLARKEIQPIAMEIDAMDVRDSFAWDMVRKESLRAHATALYFL